MRPSATTVQTFEISKTCSACGINAMNGVKMALVGLMILSAIVTFIIAGVVRWPQTLSMLAGAIVGSVWRRAWRSVSIND